MAGSKVTFVIGGAASGKSAYAEALLAGTARPLTYLATAQAFDAEMRAKIDAHIARRGSGWTTVEAPMDAAEQLDQLAPGGLCLLDCATMWLSNQMLADTDLPMAEDRLLQAIETCAADLVIVSNEVGQGIVPDNALSRRFREAQGRLNIRLAAAAQTVVHVVAGLPRALKGELP